MKLVDTAESYCDRVEASPGHRKLFLVTVRSFAEFLNADALASHLSESTVNAWVAWLRAKGCSDSYRRGRLTYLLILWRDLADDGAVPMPRRKKLTQVRVADRITHTLRLEQVRQLLAAAVALSGEYSHGIHRSLYWSSYIRTSWDTGLRGCDQLSLGSEILADGRVVIVQKKTGKRLVRSLRASTIESIRATLPPQRKLLWPLWASPEMFRRDAAGLFKSAGLDGFSLRDIRSASGTAVELTAGDGHEFLGNTRKVFEGHYLDYGQVPAPDLLPPEL